MSLKTSISHSESKFVKYFESLSLQRTIMKQNDRRRNKSKKNLMFHAFDNSKIFMVGGLIIITFLN